VLGELDGEYEPSALATLPDRLWTNMRACSEQPNGSELAMGAMVWTPIVTLSIPPPEEGVPESETRQARLVLADGSPRPQGDKLVGLHQRELNAIAHRLNTRPRKCLNFATPLEVYAHLRHHSPVALGT
jgi:hypothetical protein